VDNIEQTILSIATGTGGLERGLTSLGIKLKVAAYVEIEAFIIANLVAAMETNKMDAAPIWADVKTFPSEYFCRKIHGIIAGYPCQPFSNAGKRNGLQDARHIFPHILRIIKTTNPIWCFFENVEGHLTVGFDEVYRSLHNLGYKIEAGIFSAEEVGAPHQRKRLFILAIKMEYSNVTEIKRILIGNEKKFTDFRSSSKMAYSNNYDRGTINRKFQKKTGSIKKKTRRENWQRLWYEHRNGSKILSDTNSKRIPKSIKNTKSKQFDKNDNLWPAGPGAKQHSWEKPRTIKSGLGCTVDGYDFRIDLLRALGNGVVQQTASEAFKTLLEKF
jgi:DNA (cytosine-5)-methyltransferase 1